MSSENFSKGQILSDETIKYLKFMRDKLMEKTRIELDMIDKMIEKREEEIRREGSKAQFTNVFINNNNYDFSNTTCPQAIMKVISESKKALSAKEIADKLLQNGYRTDAKNFEKIVYNTLYNALKSKGLVQKNGILWSTN